MPTKQRTIFYFWQSDLPNCTNRTFIEGCLNKAIKGLRVAQPHLDPSLDRDTANVPGSPDIAATILDKIDNCEVFVCDISIVQSGPRPMPNPNVVFELGYAVKRLGWDRVLVNVSARNWRSPADIQPALGGGRWRTFDKIGQMAARLVLPSVWGHAP